MMMNNGLSASDVALLSGNNRNNDGFGDGAWSWIWIIVLFALFGWGGNGFGGFGGGNRGGYDPCCAPATQQGMTSAFNFNQLDNGIRGLERGLCDLGYSVQGGFGNVGQQIANLGYQNQQCCCDIRSDIKDVMYADAKNTCDIVNAIREDGNATRALITQNQMQDLRDQLNTANLQLSQQAQSANLIATLQPTPRPAYITCSPFQSQFYGWNGGYSGGCGCNSCC